jgi:metal-dependent hydrolase (beta-lactamase superfamily II)
VKTLHTMLVLAVVLMLLAGCGSTPTHESLIEQPTVLSAATGSASPTAASALTVPPPKPTATLPLLTSSPTMRPTATSKALGQMPAATPTPLLAASEAPGQVRVTIVYDNTAVEPDLAAEWGFAAWIEYGDHIVLFDTGPDGSSLLGNMAELGLDPAEIDIVVLSHNHGDHTGGLLALLDTGAQPAVYVPAAFHRSFKRLVSARTELVEVEEPVEILPGLHSTGELGAMVVEQSLAIETSAGTVVVTGCAHPGILNIVRVVQSLVDDEIALVLGGFHLLDTQSTSLDRIVEGFRDFGVKQVSPTHCTGEPAIRKFAEEFGDDYIEGGAGRVFVVGDEPSSRLAAGSGRPEPTAASALPGVLATKQLPASVLVSSPTPEPVVQPQPDGLSADEVATLGSLEMVDGYPLYTMHYYGAYTRGPSWAQVSAINRTTLVSSWSCSLFAALGDANNRLYGRNFDWEFSPALLLFTHPPDGYASVSMVDISYLVPADKVQTLADLPLAERRALLRALHWPFDGMNEHGLVVGMAAVPPGGMIADPAKPTLDSLGVIRQVLDHARDVDEAVSLFESHNVDMGGGPPLHYLLADRSGRSVLVEYYQGEMILIPNDKPWHLATNFLLSSVRDPSAGQCWRYDRIEQRLTQTQGRLSLQEAMDLLAQASQALTQWSVVYGLSTGEVQVAMGQQYDTVHTFLLP